MAVKIVTDSSSDISAEVAEKLGITVVPLYVRFGEEIFRERVTMSDDEFYRRLINGPIHPVTIQPGPNDFKEAYEKIADDADAILSIHISSKLSGTYNSAVQAKDLVQFQCPIEVIDSRLVTVALGLVVIAAAKAAQEGKSLEELVEITKQAMADTHPLCLLDTLKYLQIGGRIGKAKAMLGTVLNVKPMITIKDGEVVPAGQVRSRTKGLEILFNHTKSALRIDDLAIGYNTTLDDAIAFGQRLSTLPGSPKAMIFRLGTTLGVHVGPGTLIVAIRGKMPEAEK
jgi:DegV family protein with EDD domain